MKWGHEIGSKNGPISVTRAEYNAAFGVEVPEAPDIPDAGAHVLAWWQHLSARRPAAFDGLAPIPYTELYYWSALTRTMITPAEISIIMQIDGAYIEAVNIERQEQRERK